MRCAGAVRTLDRRAPVEPRGKERAHVQDPVLLARLLGAQPHPAPARARPTRVSIRALIDSEEDRGYRLQVGLQPAAEGRTVSFWRKRRGLKDLSRSH